MLTLEQPSVLDFALTSYTLCANMRNMVKKSSPRPNSVRDLTGQRFGRLLVEKRHPENTKAGKARWRCLCRCGNDTVVVGGSLTSGLTVSCGCFHKDVVAVMGRRNRKHGETVGKRTAEYRIWSGLLARCYNKKVKDYPRYGGRGIGVCERWRNSFEAFLEDMGRRPARNYTIERVNNDSHYTPQNCKWATMAEQNRNRRPFGSSNELKRRRPARIHPL
jgi:hypothetical protein